MIEKNRLLKMAQVTSERQAKDPDKTTRPFPFLMKIQKKQIVIRKLLR